MMIRKRIFLTCPDCEIGYYHQFKDTYLCLPISDEKKKELNKLDEYNELNSIETEYII